MMSFVIQTASNSDSDEIARVFNLFLRKSNYSFAQSDGFSSAGLWHVFFCSTEQLLDIQV